MPRMTNNYAGCMCLYADALHRRMEPFAVRRAYALMQNMRAVLPTEEAQRAEDAVVDAISQVGLHGTAIQTTLVSMKLLEE